MAPKKERKKQTNTQFFPLLCWTVVIHSNIDYKVDLYSLSMHVHVVMCLSAFLSCSSCDHYSRFMVNCQCILKAVFNNVSTLTQSELHVPSCY